MVSYTTNPGVTTMTYAGASMTQIGSNQTLGGAYDTTFYIVGATAGANSVVTTTTNALANGFAFHCNSYTGVGGTDGTSQHTTTLAAAGNDSVTMTSTIDQDFLVGTWSSGNGRTFALVAGTAIPAASNDSQGAIAYFGPVSIGSNTVTVSDSAGDSLMVNGIYFKPSVAASTPKAIIQSTWWE